MLLQQIRSLILKEFLLEWRHRSVLGGLFLYVAGTIYICYLSMRQVIDPPTWNALFWIIQVFVAVNGVAKSFLQESRGRMLYYYTIADPRAMIFSKITYNLGLMLLLTVISLAIYSLLIGNPVQDQLMFITAAFLGSLGFASVLTMVSAIASKAGNNAGLVAILGFPLLFPILLTTIRFSKNAMDGVGWAMSDRYAILLVALNALVIGLSYLLFPYLWKD